MIIDGISDELALGWACFWASQGSFGCLSRLTGWTGAGNEMFFLSRETLRDCLCGCESLLPLGAACLLSSACFVLGLDLTLGAAVSQINRSAGISSDSWRGNGCQRAVSWGRRLAFQKARVVFKSGKKTDLGIGLVRSRRRCRSDLSTTLGSN